MARLSCLVWGHSFDRPDDRAVLGPAPPGQPGRQECGPRRRRGGVGRSGSAPYGKLVAASARPVVWNRSREPDAGWGRMGRAALGVPEAVDLAS